MAKKKFTDSFESLFGDPMEEDRLQEQATGKHPDAAKAADGDEKGKVSGKDFTDSLQSFLSETFEASFERQMAENKTPKQAGKSPKKARRRNSLDMLIRSTVEPSKIEIDEDQSRRRRITLTFEPQKLEKLKKIAQVERAMLKDIINEIVGDYIRKYEIKKGEAK